MKLRSNPKVAEVIDAYPKHVKDKLGQLRNLVIERAEELNVVDLEETLKWGEPSYLTKKGSTIRIDWKPKNPDQYAIYFKCTSKLVNTFREIYGDQLKYETTRAIVFSFDDTVPEQLVKACIGMALQYHDIKHLPLLGAEILLVKH